MDVHSEFGMSADTSPAGSPAPPSQLRELPEKLIAYFQPSNSKFEPARKKRKITHAKASSDSELQYIVVKKSKWNTRFSSSKLPYLAVSVSKTDLQPYVHWTTTQQPEYIEIVDGSNQRVFHEPLSIHNTTEDLLIALLLHRDAKKWAKLEGRVWVEFSASLVQTDGCDTLVLESTIKWNTTSTPLGIRCGATKPQTFTKMIQKYFPSPTMNDSEKWSPQDFYESAHVPNKVGELSATMKVDGLESELYSFQKRTVKWLLQREGVEWTADGGIRKVEESAAQSTLPLSFYKFQDGLKQTCYVSHVLGVVTTDVKAFKESEIQLKGGILAEEMGLGKTLEQIYLIMLHQRSEHQMTEIHDSFTGARVRSTGATLIISPPSISRQWISEMNKHAPHLKVMSYDGIKSNRDLDFSALLDELARSDVVVTTYPVLAAEIHFTALNPEKTLRHASKYPRAQSPLVLLSWWRCILDEAQMIESSVSNAAMVARMIPRVNAWCVTGTPVRKDVNDLQGLLVFLRYEPYCSIKHVWSALITSHKHEFRKLFGSLALRHTKKIVRDELNIPMQKRHVITMPFTPVEEQHYRQLFEEMCEDVGLDAEGAPLSDSWSLDVAAEAMRHWLVRLRQTALHPVVGGRNRKALRTKDGPLRTIDQVLDAMIEQADLAIRTDQRALLVSILKKGQLFENSPRVKEALEIWQGASDEAALMVEECRLQLNQQVEQLKEGDPGDTKKVDASSNESDSEEEVEDTEITSRLSVYRNRLRSALEILHMAIFFKANAYFQIKSNEEMTAAKSSEYDELEKLETNGYEEAKGIRRQILQEIYTKANRLMKKISKRASTQTFVQIPEFKSNISKGGLESQRLLEKVSILASALNMQADLLDKWREATVQFLLKSLVDEDEGMEITGEEYEDSTKVQDEVMVFVQALGAVIADRYDSLTGQTNILTEHDVKVALKFAGEEKGPFPAKLIELLGVRAKIKPKKDLGSMRGFVTELRGLSTSLKTQAEGGSARAQAEHAIVQKQLEEIQKQLTEQMKATVSLEKELGLFTNVMNTRLEYYRQLQQISDTVADWEGPNDGHTMAKFLDEAAKLERKIATAKSRRRYLEHMRMEANNPKEQRICVICREEFEVGALTVCGHQYCKECISTWWAAHRSCPVCKRKLRQEDLHDVTYKPQELTIQPADASPSSPTTSSKSSSGSAIYSEISKEQLAAIKNIDLNGPSFTTKVDTLARHLIWLRQSDPGAKSIIFSQFREFLQVLAGAFEQHRIGFVSMDRVGGIEKFKNDPSVECFLLHAKSHSSGINLQEEANHVFLCEPLLNTALELQACSRVDRIGQHQETHVWLYLVDGTVEESIHQLSVKRRMEHVDRTLSEDTRKGKQIARAEDYSGTALDEANTLELQQAHLASLVAKGSGGGEIVQKEDLWACLFGSVHKRKGNLALRDRELACDEEVQRHLRAEAAEERVSGHQSPLVLL